MVSFKFLSLIYTASYALGSPLPPPAAPLLVVRDDTVAYNASLPNVTIFATGGTIAGSASSSGQTIGYQAGAVSIAALLEAVPEIVNISNVQGVQVTNVGSENTVTPRVVNFLF
ncbi:hypothetical protein ABKA04_004875 [Annulohypoxylon sp. FPYF3050]